MSLQRKPRLTPEEYLAIERRAEFKSAFFDGKMFAMSGARESHNIITVIAHLLSNKILIFKFIMFYNFCWHEN